MERALPSEVVEEELNKRLRSVGCVDPHGFGSAHPAIRLSGEATGGPMSSQQDGKPVDPHDHARRGLSRMIPGRDFRSRAWGRMIVPIQSLVVVGLGVLVAWVVVVKMRIHGDAVAVACLLIPMLVVLIPAL